MAVNNLILHIKGPYCILVLPEVEPRHLKAYARLCGRSDSGNAVGVDDSLSSLLLDLPSITGAFMVAHAIGDVITGDVVELEVVVSASPSVGGLLDSLTSSIGISGISSRAKPVAAPVAAPAASGAAVVGPAASDAPKPGTPVDLSYSTIFAIKVNGFSSSDLPPQDLKQPAWKTYLSKGKQRLLFTIHETLHAAMYDIDEIPDSLSVSGQINCRAEIEGMPDVSFPLTGLNSAHVEVLSFHPSAQVPEKGVDKQAVMFSLPSAETFTFGLKIIGASVSRMPINPKSVSIYPAVKAPVEFSAQITSGDYILWNTLGKCPSVATAKIEED